MLKAKAIRTSFSTYEVQLDERNPIVIFQSFPSMQAFAEHLCEITGSKSCQFTLVEGEAVRTITV